MMFEGKMHGLESYLTQIKTFTRCLLTYTQNLSAFFSLSRLKCYFSSSSSTPTAISSLPSNQMTYKWRRLCLEDQSELKRSALLIITDLYAVFTLFFTHTNMRSTFACLHVHKNSRIRTTPHRTCIGPHEWFICGLSVAVVPVGSCPGEE